MYVFSAQFFFELGTWFLFFMKRVRRLEEQSTGMQLQMAIREAESRVLHTALMEKDAALKEAISLAELIYAAKIANSTSS